MSILSVAAEVVAAGAQPTAAGAALVIALENHRRLRKLSRRLEG